ncbi:MAG TPA: DUF1569 domain-containing protein [Blastocatellia bacterium]|nr:DUF1569 domain-containing protein [Blastocatellia bacterium]
MMKTFWEAEARAELQQRLEQLRHDSQRRWGKMSCDEMLTHLADSCRMALGELPVKPKPGPFRYWPIRPLIIYKLPWPKGAPTAPELIARKPDGWDSEKASLLALMNRLVAESGREEWPEHPAFGRLSKKDWGVLVYRHVDHHFQQFGV